MTARSSKHPQGDQLARARETMVTVGVDAALARTGWAVISEDVLVGYGTIDTRPREAEATRLWRLWSEFGEVLRRHRTRNTYVVVERPGGWVRGKERSSLRTIEVLAAARAAVKIAAAWQDTSVVDMDVNEARRLVLGQTHAVGARSPGKAWVCDLVELRFGVRVGHDEADAIVVAAAGDALRRHGDSRFPPPA